MLCITWTYRKRASCIRKHTKVEDVLTICDEQIVDGLLKYENGNPGMLKESRTDRELDGELKLKVLLE